MRQLAVPDIYEVTTRIINLISGDLQSGSSKAYLADLRQSINKDVHQATGVFPIIFSNIPDEYLGRSGSLTAGEYAIILTLQLFALHQQGNSQSVNLQADAATKKQLGNVGTSLSRLRDVEDSQAVDRRFNAMITATSTAELANHLRHMIKLLKSKTDAKVNYPRLAQDLFWFQKGQQSSIRMQWSRSYYRQSYNKGEKNAEQ